MMLAGAASIDITPSPGLSMAGFAARTEPAIGVHDPLTARALVIGDTAIVIADVIGFHETMARRIRERSGLNPDRVIVAATHTHGGPVSMEGRLGRRADPGFLLQLEEGCVLALHQAQRAAKPAQLLAGSGRDPGVAKNRRHAEGLLDRATPLLRVMGEDGPIALLASYACHPVVLGADNRLMSADYPGFVRKNLESEFPGAIALFLTGCTGDANTGHTAKASLTLRADGGRTFKAAEGYGSRIAEALLAAPAAPLGDRVAAATTEVVLDLSRRETEPLSELARQWQADLVGSDPVRATLLRYWIDWAERFADVEPGTWTGRVTAFDWGGMPIIGLPGEIFAETGLTVRAACGDRPAFVISYAEGNPGYIPPASEFSFGGYEVDEAHRFIGMPAGFAPGSAERLADAAIGLLRTIGL